MRNKPRPSSPLTTHPTPSPLSLWPVRYRFDFSMSLAKAKQRCSKESFVDVVCKSVLRTKTQEYQFRQFLPENIYSVVHLLLSVSTIKDTYVFKPFLVLLLRKQNRPSNVKIPGFPRKLDQFLTVVTAFKTVRFTYKVTSSVHLYDLNYTKIQDDTRIFTL